MMIMTMKTAMMTNGIRVDGLGGKNARLRMRSSGG